MIRKLTLMLLLTVVAVIGISGASASSISGFKFNDANGNGTWDPVEPALPNWTIVLTMPDGSKITNTTNANGFYIFSNLSAGNYTLEEVLQPGWVRTFPNESIIKITLSEGEDVNETGFGNMQVQVPQGTLTFNISGFKINGDTGKGIQGWNITLSNDTMQTSTLTGTDGSYQFTGLLNGTYNVTEETRSDFTPNGPTSQNVTVADQDITDIDFINIPVSQQTPTPIPPSTPTLTTGSISGSKINDINGNGRWDAGEKGLSNWIIQLIGIGAETHRIRKETTTDDQGFYRFENLSAGKYLIKEKHQKGFVPTSPPVKVITLVQGENSINNNFTNRLVRSLVHIDNQRNIENKDLDNQGNIEDKKDTDDHVNIKDNNDKGNKGNIKNSNGKGDKDDKGDKGNIKDKKDLNHKDKGNKD